MKTECMRGHPYNDQNTYINPVTKKRFCRPCKAIRKKKEYQRDKRIIPWIQLKHV